MTNSLVIDKVILYKFDRKKNKEFLYNTRKMLLIEWLQYANEIYVPKNH